MKENELKIRQKLLTAVSPWFLSVYGITHFSDGKIVENGSDLTENWKAVEVGALLGESGHSGIWHVVWEELHTSLACTCGRIDADITYLKLKPCPLACSSWDADVFIPFLICLYGSINGAAPAPKAGCLPSSFTSSGLEPCRICPHQKTFLLMTY